MRRALLWLGLAACGDNLPPPIDAPPANPDLLVFTPCRTPPLECATLVVPADWSAPGGATIALPVVRAPARDPAQRIGALTFNFGGPGGATLDPIANNYPFQPIASTTDLTQRFDFVLMDWRGVATTTPALSCLNAQTGAELSHQRFAPQSDADWTQLFELVGEVAAGCTANAANAPLLAHQDTESAARDFDALRVGLGEDKLNMWGVSYGTRLGAMYSELFPDHARAIAIDSPVEPDPQFEQTLQDQSVSFEAELQRFFAWCAAATTATCPFRTADGLASSVAAAYAQLLATADVSPVVNQGVTLDRPTINLVATTLMYFPAYQWSQLARALAALAAGTGTQAVQLFEADAIDDANNDNEFMTYQNVSSQDMPLPSGLVTAVGYQQWAETQDAIAPHVGLQNAAAQAFAVDWPSTIPPQHAIGATTAPPLLITATRHDPATPYPGAGLLQAAFANGSYLVTYEGDGHANAQFEQCLGNAVASFLIDPTTAPATSDCVENVVDAAPVRAAPFRVGHRWHRTH